MNWTYGNNISTNKRIQIPWAKELYVRLIYWTQLYSDYLYVFKGNYYGSLTENMDNWQLYTFNWWWNDDIRTVDFYVEWDTVTFSFYSNYNYNYYWY